MLAFLLALLGGTVGLAGLSGGGSKTSAVAAPRSENLNTPPVAVPIIESPDADTPDDDDDMSMDHGDDDDMPQNDGGMSDMPMDDDMPMDHSDDDDMPKGDGGTADMPMDHGDHADTPQDDDTAADTPVGHGDHADTPQDDDTAADTPMDHGDHADTPQDDDTAADTPMDHGDHGSNVKLPVTQAEINAFVTMVRTGEEAHVHGHGDDRAGEHMEVMDLVDPADATHIAIGHGSWFDPDNWHNGEVPGANAKVVIPDGVYMEYDQESDTSLFTVRVDGQLEFANDTDSKMVVDTFIVAPSGTLTIGTESDPIADDVNVEIVIANNGAIDTNWDPGLFSRGLISHGKTEIHGEIKDSHEKVIEDPMAGDTSIKFATLPDGWEVGDKIVIAGTEYDGYAWDGAVKATVNKGSEDEVRYISQIDGNRVYFDEPLEHDHDTPRADLKTSVANYSRNVTIKSEDGDDSEVFERGHVMMMHSDDVDIRYAAFEELGRTDKSEDRFVGDENSYDSNVAGRYGLHLHRTGVESSEDPTILTGNAVFGSPGWGIVQHDSHAIIDNNATFDTFGAGFVAESGNETGTWTNNIAIFAEGVSWGDPKTSTDLETFDTAKSGDGFWFQGRLVSSHDNVAASVNNGFVYFHRGSDGNHTYDASTFELEKALHFGDAEDAQSTPVTAFSGNETFAASQGLHVVKSAPEQGHDIHSVFEDFTAWEVDIGAHFEYTAHYILKDFDVIGNGVHHGSANTHLQPAGISMGTNTFDFTIIDSKINGFYTGITLGKGWTPGRAHLDDSDNHFSIVNPQMSNVIQEYRYLNPEYDEIINEPVSEKPVTVSIDGPLTYGHATKSVSVTGTVHDGLGSRDFPTAAESYDITFKDMTNIIQEDGYYTADDGHNYVTHSMFFSDRLTGDIYKQDILIKLDTNVSLGVKGLDFADAKFKGYVGLEQLENIAGQPAQKVHDAGQFNDDGSIIILETASDELWKALTIEHGTYGDQAAMDMMDMNDTADHHDHMTSM